MACPAVKVIPVEAATVAGQGGLGAGRYYKKIITSCSIHQGSRVEKKAHSEWNEAGN